jgi:hypothetical protein
MTQSELNRQIARATGESITTIARLGFVPLTETPSESQPTTIDWDETDRSCHLSFQPVRKRAPRLG